ncbi:PAS domain-containing protein, partial [Escherichia coli]|uniref:PAS domain-containing protein n=1 Tax=Escherichia coli TaxID=562 RepID=UPI001EDA572A
LDPGAAHRELRLEQVLSAVHPDDHADLAAAISEALMRGGRYAHQYRTRNAEGQYRWIEAIGRVDLDAEGRATGFQG